MWAGEVDGTIIQPSTGIRAPVELRNIRFDDTPWRHQAMMNEMAAAGESGGVEAYPWEVLTAWNR